MGMFDSVYARCPKCLNAIEFQSKAGECQLRKYSIDSVPIEIAEDLDGASNTCDCGEVVTLKIPITTERVTMAVAMNGEFD